MSAHPKMPIGKYALEAKWRVKTVQNLKNSKIPLIFFVFNSVVMVLLLKSRRSSEKNSFWCRCYIAGCCVCNIMYACVQINGKIEVPVLFIMWWDEQNDKLFIICTNPLYTPFERKKEKSDINPHMFDYKLSWSSIQYMTFVG